MQRVTFERQCKSISRTAREILYSPGMEKKYGLVTCNS